MTSDSPQLARLLKDVSRSFYLSLRLLPSPVRSSLSLAYLLARASDSIADAATAPRETRLGILKGLPHMWPHGAAAELGVSRAEDRRLIEAIPSLVAQLGGSPDRKEIEAVWRTIREGQLFDLTRFPSSEPLTLEEGRRYTGLVAGCVGGFWTDLCLKHIPDYSSEDPETLRRLGFSFGCGLQWVNILRDRHDDAAAGRLYLGPSGFSPALAIAGHHLSDGLRYSESIRPRRLRAACRLPLDLGFRTLDLVASNPDIAGLKVGRPFVWRSLALALIR